MSLEAADIYLGLSTHHGTSPGTGNTGITMIHIIMLPAPLRTLLRMVAQIPSARMVRTGAWALQGRNRVRPLLNDKRLISWCSNRPERL